MADQRTSKKTPSRATRWRRIQSRAVTIHNALIDLKQAIEALDREVDVEFLVDVVEAARNLTRGVLREAGKEADRG